MIDDNRTAYLRGNFTLHPPNLLVLTISLVTWDSCLSKFPTESIRRALYKNGFSPYSSPFNWSLIPFSLGIFCIKFTASWPCSVFTSLIIVSCNTRATLFGYKLALPAQDVGVSKAASKNAMIIFQFEERFFNIYFFLISSYIT